NQVRTRLPAGGRRIRTIGPGTKEPVFVAEGELRDRTGAAKKGCFLCGTDGSNPSPSSDESSANLIFARPTFSRGCIAYRCMERRPPGHHSKRTKIAVITSRSSGTE